MFSRSVYKKELLEKYSSQEFENNYTYNGNDLGATWSKKETIFKIWTPVAQRVVLNLYISGDYNQNDLIESYEMIKEEKGVYCIRIPKDIKNIYYTYLIIFLDHQVEICDPYAKAVGVNGKRAMVIDFNDTNPDNWDMDQNPNKNMSPNEYIIYELHTRDFSADKYSGIDNKGKFLGLVEENTFIPQNKRVKTGLSYLKDLGITHLHLLPISDYASLDESEALEESEDKRYNWGYDPLNYNVPEGTYATDPFDGRIRIKEFKQAIKKLHENGISVVMDVVYNHTYNEEFCFNMAIPGYFYRIDINGNLSNGSCCGNDTASERSMVRKYIVDSVKYWAEEYHIDGFRFDLMGLIDVETMNCIRKALDEVNPDIFMYGEGWHLKTVLTKKNVQMATQSNSLKLNRISFFSDDIRNAIKGSVFEPEEKGYISGNKLYVEDIKKGIMGLPDWATSPKQVINYESCHDNYTLFDKLSLCNKNISFTEKVKQNKLAAAIIMLSQGIPLLHAGEEILREKRDKNGEYISDSVMSPDYINSLKWNNLTDEKYLDVYEYYKGLIQFRKANELFHLDTKEKVKNAISFIDTKDDNLIYYTLSDTENKIIVLMNAMDKDAIVDIDDEYDCYIDENKAGNIPLSLEKGNVCVKAHSCKVLKNRK